MHNNVQKRSPSFTGTSYLAGQDKAVSVTYQSLSFAKPKSPQKLYTASISLLTNEPSTFTKVFLKIGGTFSLQMTWTKYINAFTLNMTSSWTKWYWSRYRGTTMQWIITLWLNTKRFPNINNSAISCIHSLWNINITTSATSEYIIHVSHNPDWLERERDDISENTLIY